MEIRALDTVSLMRFPTGAAPLSNLPVDEVLPGRPAPPARLVLETPVAASAPGVWTPTALAARETGALFDKFLHYRNFELEVQRPGFVEKMPVPVLHGKGHNCAMVGAYTLDAQGQPCLVLKAGDTRLSRLLRGMDYAMPGFVGGRMDHDGAGFAKIAMSELPEEVGGEAVPSTFRRLGAMLSPTMPLESTEADAYFSTLTILGAKPSGDGGGMELPAMLGAHVVSARDGLRQMDEGKVVDSGRARTTYGRTFDAIGYLPSLGVWVQDHPQLLGRFDTLGLGPVNDPRGQARMADPRVTATPPPVNSVEYLSREEVDLGQGARMIDAETRHAVDGVGVEAPFANQVMTLPYDRAKVVEFVLDPVRGPLISMSSRERPVQAVKGLLLGAECDTAQENCDYLRRDVLDLKVDRSVNADSCVSAQLGAGRLMRLAEPSLASSGQSDMAYHSYALEVAQAEDAVPLAEALLMCRTGQGDANTEAALLRLADRLGWIPGLGMSVEQARRLL